MLQELDSGISWIEEQCDKLVLARGHWGVWRASSLMEGIRSNYTRTNMVWSICINNNRVRGKNVQRTRSSAPVLFWRVGIEQIQSPFWHGHDRHVATAELLLDPSLTSLLVLVVIVIDVG